MEQQAPSQQPTFFPPSLQHTKILCTLGPATATQERIKQMIIAGADAIRLNFSHSRHETHRKLYDMTRAAAKELNRHIPIIQDLQGPKIRIGALPGGPILLRPASKVILTTDPVLEGDERIPVAYKKLADDVQPGDMIFLDDGLLTLRVEAKSGKNIRCNVINGGLLKEHKGVNLPGVAVSEPRGLKGAQDSYDVAYQTVVTKLGDDSAYTAAVKEQKGAEGELAAARKDGRARDAAALAGKVMEAKKAVHKMEAEAAEKDEGVKGAKAKVAEAKAAVDEMRKGFEEKMKNKKLMVRKRMMKMKKSVAWACQALLPS